MWKFFKKNDTKVPDIDRELIKDKFIEIVKYYNDVIMTNTLVLSEKETLEYQKQIFVIEKEREKYLSKQDKATKIDTDEKFYKYILKKIENIQSTLINFNKQISFFYSKYKFTYESVSIVIIILSSSLSLIEGITLCFSTQNTVSTIISLIVSTSIAVLTSILKFKNIKEKIEELVKVREKISACQAKLYTFDKDLKASFFLYDNNNNDGYNKGDSIV